MLLYKHNTDQPHFLIRTEFWAVWMNGDELVSVGPFGHQDGEKTPEVEGVRVKAA